MKEIILFRSIGPARLRWRFVVDDHDTIVMEGPVPEEYTSAYTEAKAAAPVNTVPTTEVQKRHVETLEKRGIKYEILADGRIHILSIPSKERHISQFLEHLKDYCNDAIPNCVALRTQMQKEIEASGGLQCPQCELNRIKQKYRELLEKIIVTP